MSVVVVVIVLLVDANRSPQPARYPRVSATNPKLNWINPITRAGGCTGADITHCDRDRASRPDRYWSIFGYASAVALVGSRPEE
ncbi:hypothetical protein N7481_003211 [Penicillium waksmanii]|uniref:uncharacterized protein n=1 Tax=Penicillium waksmanii TaxID=69791 RepID=UPI0025474F2D|nr:uncharacterized protein N7481_003211 [Penicillium waksmanii]KAJ5988001.1 hypothetical protein N7481_003211 [Penicillium waksmanii]